jgi:hypothetical protein
MDDFRQPPPKPDPNRWSTNKRVKVLGENIFGTKIREADGAKKVRPGDPNSTSAKTERPPENPDKRMRAAIKTGVIDESFLSYMRYVKSGRGSTDI